MSLELAILGFLDEHPRSGYDLKTRCFSGPVAAFWGADQAQIYRTLERLNRDGRVIQRRRRQSGKPDRKLYEVTVSGREALHSLLARPDDLPPLRDAFLLQLFFARKLTDAELLTVLRSRRDLHQSRLDSLRTHATNLASDHSIAPRDSILRHTALEGAIAQQRAAIDWLDDCIDAVEAGSLPGHDGEGIGQRHLFGS